MSLSQFKQLPPCIFLFLGDTYFIYIYIYIVYIKVYFYWLYFSSFSFNGEEGVDPGSLYT